MLETWDWYLDRYRDRPVLGIIKERIFAESPNQRTRKGLTLSIGQPTEMVYNVAYLAFRLNRSTKSISKSLDRLHAQDKIKRYLNGWRLKV
jgi:Fe-S cluster assembly ATPase SufC